MSAADLLERVAERLSDPARWTQGAYARDETGYDLGVARGPRAVCWCIRGAVQSEWSSSDTVAAARAIQLIEAELPGYAGGSIVEFNDDARTKHADALGVVRRAAAKAKAAGI